MQESADGVPTREILGSPAFARAFVIFRASYGWPRRGPPKRKGKRPAQRVWARAELVIPNDVMRPRPNPSRRSSSSPSIVIVVVALGARAHVEITFPKTIWTVGVEEEGLAIKGQRWEIFSEHAVDQWA